MKTEKITASNISCGACVNAITKKLKQIEGVKTVDVNKDTQLVTVTLNENLNRQSLITVLSDIGYPEAN
jgi:copper chaperone CopZ